MCDKNIILQPYTHAESCILIWAFFKFTHAYMFTTMWINKCLNHFTILLFNWSSKSKFNKACFVVLWNLNAIIFCQGSNKQIHCFEYDYLKRRKKGIGVITMTQERIIFLEFIKLICFKFVMNDWSLIELKKTLDGKHLYIKSGIVNSFHELKFHFSKISDSWKPNR